MRYLIPFTISFFFMQGFCALAQNADTLVLQGDETIELQIENMASNAESEMDYSDWQEELEQLRRHPVNLNSANEDELRRLFFLNDIQITNLLEYKLQYGNIVSIYELQVVEGFDANMLLRMQPYISFTEVVAEKFSFKKAFKYGSVDLMLRGQRILEQQKGYIEAPDSARRARPSAYYTGGPYGMFFKAEYGYKDFLRMGIVTDKDAGEPFLTKWDTLPKGFDFVSAHVFVQKLGVIKQLALGDYHLQFGQGLTIWSGFSVSKAPGSVAARRRAAYVRPHVSSNEYDFMRGAATTIGLGKFDFTAFYSNRYVDANTLPPDTISDTEEMITSLQQSGYHRTIAEQMDKHSAREILMGTHLNYAGQRFRLGATAFRVEYDKKFSPPASVYKWFQPDISEMAFGGLDYSYNYNKATLYGEFSQLIGQGYAFIQGFNFAAGQRVSFSAVYRDYQKNYYNPFGAAFGESSVNNNEKGLYMGMIVLPLAKLSINAYADRFWSGWLRYRVDAPSQGSEYSIQAIYAISRKGDLLVSYRQRTNPQNFSQADQNLNSIGDATRNYYRVQVNYQVLPWMKIQSRIEIVHRNAGGVYEKGYLIYQGFQFKPVEGKWVIYSRYALFDTDSYESRLYAYENDVPYAFSIPAFSGNGSRFYVQAGYTFNRNVSVTARFSRTWYSHTSLIGSGLDEIQGDRKSDVKLVLKIEL